MSGPAKIFVGTPTTNGLMLSDFVTSLVAMMARLHREGIGVEYRNVDGPNLMIQRDMLAQSFLASDCSHLLLIDAEMAFRADLAERLLGAGKRLVGTVTPRCPPDLAKVRELAATRGVETALALACDWNVRFLDNTLSVEKGFCRVAALGPGFVLIERACLEEMLERAEVAAYQHADATLRAFFRDLREREGALSPPDHLFSERWAACGGEVWAYAGAEIRRIGDFAYGVPFRRYLEATRRGLPPAT